jgi:hypothetical protein
VQTFEITAEAAPTEIWMVLAQCRVVADSCPFPFPYSRRLNGKSWKKQPLSLGAKKGSKLATVESIKT